MKMRDDILKAMNRGEVTLVVFLDYSKAFDTKFFWSNFENLASLLKQQFGCSRI